MLVTPKWLVYNGKSPYKLDELGVPLFQETTIYPTTYPHEFRKALDFLLKLEDASAYGWLQGKAWDFLVILIHLKYVYSKM